MRKQNFDSKNNNFSAFLQIYGVNYDNQGYKRENIQHLNKLEVYLANFNTKSCKEEKDDIVNTFDIVHIVHT